jgi:hypothetical protein
VLHDANGERTKSADWLTVHSDAADALEGAISIEWIKRTGDVGTAMGATLAAIALESARMGDGAGERALISLLSDDGARGAFALDLPQRGGALDATTAPRPRHVGRPRRPAAGLHAAAAGRALAEVVDEVAGLLLLPTAEAEGRLASQLDAALALARPGPRAWAHADIRAALAAFRDRSPPVTRAAEWVGAHLPPATRRPRSAPTG